MLPERPLLTIAIPTYNRADCLNVLLRELIPQITDDRVELLISDNASPDHTPKIVDAYCPRDVKINYIRNRENIGPDANFLQCYNLAKGEYVWIVGDDDVIVPGGLRQVLKILEKREFDQAFVSAYTFRDAYSPPERSRFSGRVVVFSNAVNYALRTYTGLAFITGNILRKATLEAKPHPDFSEMIGTNLIHLSWTYTLLSMNPKCILFRDRLVAVKTENTGGYGTCQVFGKNLKEMVRLMLGEDSEVGRALLNRNLQSFLPWATVEDRSGKSVNNLPEDTEAILRGLYGGNIRYWIFLWPALKLPLPLAKMWVFLVKVIGRIDRAVGYPISR
jgi:abequosyltransferase